MKFAAIKRETSIVKDELMKRRTNFVLLSVLGVLSGCGGGTANVGGGGSGGTQNTPPPQGKAYVVLHTFKGGAEGAFPNQGLIRDAAGNLYGTAAYDGDLACPDGGGFGCGTIFKLDSSGAFTTLHVFAGGPTDGALPNSGLIRDTEGNLYGTTVGGGTHQSGVVFKLDATGTETVLHHLTGKEAGLNPTAGLVRDDAGNLYGATQLGGELSCPDEPGLRGCGIVFKLAPSGIFTVLHAFAGGAEGVWPHSLIRDGAGNLYGVTAYGGDLNCFFDSTGCGTIFKLSPSGSLTTLHAFTQTEDGATTEGEFPGGPLTRDEAGNLYGTTSGGGRGLGGIVKLELSGQMTTLLSFRALDGGEEGDDPGGQNPTGGLLRDDAVLYGTTINGGTSTRGVVFGLNLESGKETVLYTFRGGTDGGEPNGGLVGDNAGNLYGTTSRGGDLACHPLDGGCGVVFKIKVP